MKKKLSICIISLMLIASSASYTQVFAKESTTSALPSSASTYMQSAEISPLAAETKWCYRTLNGVKQRRLWSNSQKIWLTEWENY